MRASLRLSSSHHVILCTAALSCALLLATAVSFASTKPYQAAWPQASSDLQPDAAVKFGQLPNGMHYAIMHNNTPIDAVSLRLRMATGSLQESDAQQGLAHLLEHMAFRGSKNVPDGEVIKTLERIGLQFGADTNAFTGHTETVYKFDLPKASDDNVNTGLMLLREIASELNITDEALKTERGVVLSEYRMRHTAEERADEDELSTLMPGMRASLRFPGGKTDVLEKADSTLVRSYYAAYYHPERATLIVVGNIDPQAIEKKIIAKFSNWHSIHPGAADPDLGHVKQLVDTTHIYVEPGLPTNISLDWANDYDASANTRNKEREDIIRSIGLTVLNQRFQQAALGNDAPFTTAQASYFDNLFHSVRGMSLGINTTPEKWSTSLVAVQQILNAVLTQGVRQDEVDRAIANMRTGIENAVTGANTRRTPSLAEGLANSVDNNEVFLSPQQNADLANAALKDLNADTVTKAICAAFTGTNSLVHMTSGVAIEGGNTKLAAMYKQAVNATAAAKEAPSTLKWPYIAFGEAGKVVKQTKLDDIDTTFVRFSNGVTLAVKQTAFSAGQVEVSVRVGDGRLGVDKSKGSSILFLNALITGGLDAIDFPTMQKALAGKSYGVKASIGDSNVVLNGRTTPADLDTELQVIAAYLAAPALRGAAVEQFRSAISAQLPQLEAQPLTNLSVHVSGLIRSNDPRWSFPDMQQIKDVKLDDLKSWLIPQLKQGSIQVNIVGDISVERAIAAVTTTLAALPTRPVATLHLSASKEVQFPAPTTVPTVLRHSGSKDQAAVFIAWPAPDRRASFTETADLYVLTAIMQARLLDAMRSHTGSSYTANVAYDGAWTLKGFGALLALSDVKPEQSQVFYDAINTMVDDLRMKLVSADEFARAQQPMMANIEKELQNNSALASQIVSTDVDPQAAEWQSKRLAFIKAVTPEQVQAVAKKYLLAENSWKAVMLPQVSATAAP